MNHRLLSIPFILIITLVTSFNYSKIEKIDYIVYGVYCGECVGNCANMYKLDDEQLLIDTTSYFFSNKEYFIQGNFKGQKLSKEKFDSAKILIQKFPDFLLKSEDKTFGSPDSYDQCGIFLQVYSYGKRRTFFIDTNLEQIPLELRDYIRLIMKI